MIKLFKIIIILFAASAAPFAQQDQYITVTGDSLVGKVLNGEAVREVHGNVVLTQGDVVITCNRAVQYISRNDADLIGDVVIKQDSLTITTPIGFYYGNERRAFSNSGVTLDDQKVILSADTGEYFFDPDIAYFQSDVTLYDTATTLTSDRLTYYRNMDEAAAAGNVTIIDKDNIILADSLTHFRSTRITFADNNVRITSRANNVTIFGGHLEDYSQRAYTLITIDPVLVQIDSSYISGSDSLADASADTLPAAGSRLQIDTLIIRALTMEAFRDTQNIFKAVDSVSIWRGTFASRNDFTIYYRDNNKIVTTKSGTEAPQPVLWYENSQLTGDSVAVFLVENRIELLEVERDAFVLSQSEDYGARFDQISGDRLKLFFEDGILNRTEVYGSVLSIYFLYEEGKANGLTKSSSQSAAIAFDEGQVSEVRLYGTPTSEFYPEPQVAGKEREFTLPAYKYFGNRPKKEQMLEGLPLE